MKKTIALIATVALLVCIVPGLALAQIHEGDLIITEPGVYSDLQVTGNIIIRCSGVLLQGVTGGTIVVETEGADVIIDANCVVEGVEVAEGATGASVEINGTVTGSVTIYALAADMTVGNSAVVNSIIVSESASAAMVTVGSGAQLASFTNNSYSTTVSASSSVVSSIEGKAVVVNEVYAL